MHNYELVSLIKNIFNDHRFARDQEYMPAQLICTQTSKVST